MAVLIAFYSRAGENYFGGAVTKGLAIPGSSVDSAKTTLEKWVCESR